ncbi:MAG: response regulator transcription factor [Bacteroidota bacterium]|nr:response regulator transcription factor [Bacteroidota bacterium]
MGKIRVMIVDDHDMFRDGIKLLLSSGDIAEIVAECRDGKEFLSLISETKPDIVLMDIDMPVMNGIEATRIASEQFPDLKVLVLTMFGDEKYYVQMIKYGIKGFVLKSAGISELLTAITGIIQGKTYFSTELLNKMIVKLSSQTAENSKENEEEKLTKREIQILKEIVKGLSNEDIAKKLSISTTTVRTHRAHLIAKTNCNNTASLVMYALKTGIVKVG